MLEYHDYKPNRHISHIVVKGQNRTYEGYCGPALYVEP